VAFEQLLSSLSLDFGNIMKSVLIDAAIDKAEDFVLGKLGNYGWKAKLLYDIYSDWNLSDKIRACFGNVGSGHASIFAVQSGKTRISNGVKAEGNFDIQTILRSFVVTYGDAYDTLVKTQEELKLDSIKLYDITLVRGGKEIQPTSTVTVYIPIPDGWNAENLNVYRMIYDGGDFKAFQNVSARIEGGYLVYETDHFSYYAIVNGEIPSGPEPNQKQYFRLWGKTTRWEKTFWNWVLLIVCFGWIWMAF